MNRCSRLQWLKCLLSVSMLRVYLSRGVHSFIPRSTNRFRPATTSTLTGLRFAASASKDRFGTQARAPRAQHINLVSSSWLNGNHVLNPSPTALTMAARSATTASRPYRLVIVESPSKCNTISKILEQYVKDNGLDHDYVVKSSMGHVRDLPKKKSSRDQKVAGVDIDNGYQPTYVTIDNKAKVIKELQDLAEDSQQVVLATDEDREGEAMAWHLTQLLPSASYTRVTFTEITAKAIRKAFENPRDTLDMSLVQAQETRRVLDRLAGFTVSPVLWKKIAPGLSAGRVQSVGMALIVQRERERLTFQSTDYCGLEATLEGNVTATLTEVNDQPVASSGADFDNKGELIKRATRPKLHLREGDAKALLDAISNDSTWTVKRVASKRRTQNPPMPFTTSTLQQEANRQLGLTVAQTMQCAQRLYEGGFISYMRTDSTHMSAEAHQAANQSIAAKYSQSMIFPPRKAKTQKKNVQEAHEAIRPAIQTDGSFLDKLPSSVDPSSQALHKLITGRTLASRMIPQVSNSTSFDIEGISADGETKLLFRISGSVVLEPGFTLALGKNRNETTVMLPPWKEGQVLECWGVESNEKHTQPPARYNEASFVKELEAVGVGRPSTYARIVSVLRERAYMGNPVKKDGYVRSRGRRSRSGGAIIAQRAAGGEG